MINIDFEYYKTHPRVLEIRFILLFDMFEREFGYSDTLKFYETICEHFRCDFTKVMGLVNKRFEIKRYSKTKLTKWRQEVIFAAACYGETIYKVAKDYLIMSSQNIYGNPRLKIDNFVTDEWLRELDREASLCGMKPYRIEVERFFEIIDHITNVVVKWKGK